MICLFVHTTRSDSAPRSYPLRGGKASNWQGTCVCVWMRACVLPS